MECNKHLKLNKNKSEGKENDLIKLIDIFRVYIITCIDKLGIGLYMDASELKWVNSILDYIKVNLLRLGGLHIEM